MKVKSLSVHAVATNKNTGPPPSGAMADGPGLVSAGAAGAMWNEPRVADQRQPRLVAGATCLIEAFETFETLCVLSELMFLWER